MAYRNRYCIIGYNTMGQLMESTNEYVFIQIDRWEPLLKRVSYHTMGQLMNKQWTYEKGNRCVVKRFQLVV